MQERLKEIFKRTFNMHLQQSIEIHLHPYILCEQVKVISVVYPLIENLFVAMLMYVLRT